MSPDTAKKRLRTMPLSFTPGSIVQLFGEVIGELATADPARAEQCRTA